MRISLEDAKRFGWVDQAKVKPSLIELAIEKLSPNKSDKRITKTPRKPNKREIEGEEQVLFIDWMEATYPQLAHLLIHIPNGGYRKNAFEGWRLKRQGVRKGVSDLLFACPCNGYAGLWIEFKASAPNNAPATEEQLFWLSEMKKQGYQAQLCIGLTEAQKTMIEYLRNYHA